MSRFQSAFQSTSVSELCECCECAVLSYLSLEKISKHVRGRVGNEGSPGMSVARHLHVVRFHQVFHGAERSASVWVVIRSDHSATRHDIQLSCNLLVYWVISHSATRSRLKAVLTSYPLRLEFVRIPHHHDVNKGACMLDG